MSGCKDNGNQFGDSKKERRLGGNYNEENKKIFCFLVCIFTISSFDVIYANSELPIGVIELEEASQDFVPHTDEYELKFYCSDPLTRKTDIIPIKVVAKWESATIVKVTFLNQSSDRNVETLLLSIYPCDKNGMIGSYRNQPIVEAKNLGYLGHGVSFSTRVNVPRNNNYLHVSVSAVQEPLTPDETIIPGYAYIILSRF